MKYQEFLSKNPVFTLDELDGFLAYKGLTNPWSRNSMLSYYRRQGRLLMVRRGLYAFIPLGASQETAQPDPYLLAGKMTSDAVLAYHTALEFHGKAYSVSERFFYLSKVKSLDHKFRSFEFRCVPVPKRLQEKGMDFYGVESSERSGVDLRVTSLERTLVDVMDRPDLAGSWEEIWRSLELVEFFNLDTVVQYALLLENATTAAKVGFFLDQHRDALMVEEEHLKPLKEMRPRQPHYLEREKRNPVKLVKAWNLIVPEMVLNRAWAEVL